MSKFGLIDNTLEGRMKVFFPHFTANRVPLDLAQNRVFRQRIQKTSNVKDRRTLWKMCREDLLFYVSTFVNLFDAGDMTGKPGAVPFVPYEFQVECFTAMWQAMHEGERKSVRGKKPRRIGFTYMVVSLFEHCWHFFPDRHLLIGSRREEEVDGSATLSKGGPFTGEWSKLMPKFDFIHIYQPSWMWPPGYRPRVEPFRVRMKLMNPANGSIIWGTSSAGTAGRQERGFAAFWDEAAHTDNLYDIIGGLSEFAPCKIWVSSIGNLDHAFSTTLKESPDVVQLSPEWWMHPEYSKDMTIDAETGARSSPWLERKLDSIGNDPVIANREYFADESQQEGGYYSPDTYRKLLGTSDKPGTVCEPALRGELDIIDTPEGPRVTRFCEQPNGRWFLWLNLDHSGRPSRHTRYAGGWDIAAGSTDTGGRGASNTVGAFGDLMNGEKVAQFVTHGKRPKEVARIAVAAHEWFQGNDGRGAFMVPERNGNPGDEFVEAVNKDYGFTHIYTELSTRGKESKVGWYKSKESGHRAFGAHQDMLCDGRYTERSEECVKEMRHYEWNPTPKSAPIHSASRLARDPSGARENHGDRVMATVCLCLALIKPYEAQPQKGIAPWGSYRAMRESEQQDAESHQLVGSALRWDKDGQI